MATAPDLALLLCQTIYGDDKEEKEMKGLGFVDFYFLPHLNSPYFPERMEENAKKSPARYQKRFIFLIIKVR